MLYRIGSVELDTRPFNVDAVRVRASASFGVKPLLNRRPGREKTGEGDERLILTGQLLPFKTGGLSELEILHDFRKAQTRLPVMRGDGKMMGWFAIEKISEGHRELMRDGVGFIVRYSVNMVRVEPGGAGIIGTLVSVFGALAR